MKTLYQTRHQIQSFLNSIFWVGTKIIFFIKNTQTDKDSLSLVVNININPQNSDLSCMYQFYIFDSISKVSNQPSTLIYFGSLRVFELPPQS